MNKKTNNTKIKLPPYEYDIEYVDEDFISSGIVACGNISYTHKTIKIRSGINEVAMRQIIWHELIHALNDLYVLDLDERQTDCLANGVLTLLKENKWLNE